MHFLLLLVVLLGWILFLFLSWQFGLPLYVTAVMISLATYWKIINAQRKAPVTGKKAMIGDHMEHLRKRLVDEEMKGKRQTSEEALQPPMRFRFRGSHSFSRQIDSKKQISM